MGFLDLVSRAAEVGVADGARRPGLRHAALVVAHPLAAAGRSSGLHRHRSAPGPRWPCPGQWDRRRPHPSGLRARGVPRRARRTAPGRGPRSGGTLIAMGYGLAVWMSRVVRLSPGGRLEALIGTAGAAAAIAIVLGNPLTAVIFLAEAVASPVGRSSRHAAALLGVGSGHCSSPAWATTRASRPSPCNSSSWTPCRPDVGDLLWAVPVGVVAAVAMSGLFTAGLRVADRVGPLTRGRLIAATMVVGLAVALCASAYSLITGRNPFDVASSGTETLKEITSDPSSWGVSDADRPAASSRLSGTPCRWAPSEAAPSSRRSCSAAPSAC